MKNFKFSAIFLLCCLVLTLLMPPAALAVADPYVEAGSIFLIDTSTQQVLYSSSAEEKTNPQSLAHIVSVLLTLEAIDSGTLQRDDAIVVPDDFDKDFSPTAVRSGFAAGETVILENLLYCALLEQSDDACALLAYAVAGGTEAFVTQMNDYANALGCTDTRFAAPGNYSGEAAHHTTAKDAAQLLQKALAHPGFSGLAASTGYSLPETDKNAARPLDVNTKFLSPDASEYYANAKSAIVSRDETAIFASASSGSIPLLVIVFDADPGECYTAAVTAFNWVFLNFQYSNILTMLDVVAEVEVAMANDGETVKLCPDRAIALLTPKNETVDFHVQYTYRSEHLSAPIKKDAVLGDVTILHDGVVCATARLLAKNAVSRSPSQYILSYLRSTLLRPSVLILLAVVLILLILYIYSVIRYRRRRRAYLAHKQEAALHTSTPEQESQESQESQE